MQHRLSIPLPGGAGSVRQHTCSPQSLTSDERKKKRLPYFPEILDWGGENKEGKRVCGSLGEEGGLCLS